MCVLKLCQNIFVHLQNELLLAAEAGKSSQRVDLENHLKTHENFAAEKNAELAKVKQQLEQV